MPVGSRRGRAKHHPYRVLKRGALMLLMHGVGEAEEIGCAGLPEQVA